MFTAHCCGSFLEDCLLDVLLLLRTLQFEPLEIPACFAFPKRRSGRHKYYQPTGYHYFTNKPVLLNLLCMPGVMKSMHQ